MPDNKTKYGIDDIVQFNTEDKNDNPITCYGVITEIKISKVKEPEYVIVNKEPDYINESDIVQKVGHKKSKDEEEAEIAHHAMTGE
jgi:hypothetical protein